MEVQNIFYIPAVTMDPQLLITCFKVDIWLEMRVEPIYQRYFSAFFFFYLGFLSRTFTIHRTADEGGSYFINSSHHFHPLPRHLDISWVITAGSSPLHIASSRTRTGSLFISECKSLTTKLRTLNFEMRSSFLS